jgi:hypothetical protein
MIQFDVLFWCIASAFDVIIILKLIAGLLINVPFDNINLRCNIVLKLIAGFLIL